jgi:monoamine oxidase
VLDSSSYDWNGAPHSKGTWASYRPHWVEKYYAEFQQHYGRIYFGSGDHGEGWRGTIDGAIGAGTRAAQRVKTLLG